MRLSSLLSKAPAVAEAEVEGFLGGSGSEDDDESPIVAAGHHEMIDVGKVILNFVCKSCGDVRTFLSGTELSCLVVGERVASIDACLTCAAECGTSVECWFLIVSRGALDARSPTIRLERFVDNRRDSVSRVGAQIGAGDFDELLERAQIAYEESLGAGSIVYLRIILETLTRQIAANTGINITGKKGGRRPFRDLLEEVDQKHRIIPSAFAGEGYRLFSELSEFAHGSSGEDAALQNFAACRDLVVGTVQHVASDQAMKKAVQDLGWVVNTLNATSSKEIAS